MDPKLPGRQDRPHSHRGVFKVLTRMLQFLQAEPTPSQKQSGFQHGSLGVEPRKRLRRNDCKSLKKDKSQTIQCQPFSNSDSYDLMTSGKVPLGTLSMTGGQAFSYPSLAESWAPQLSVSMWDAQTHFPSQQSQAGGTWSSHRAIVETEAWGRELRLPAQMSGATEAPAAWLQSLPLALTHSGVSQSVLGGAMFFQFDLLEPPPP
jgi:hypothetical protein